MVSDEMKVAFILALARHNVRPDVQELLLRGDGRGTVAPGALDAALEAVAPLIRAAALEEAAGVADACLTCVPDEIAAAIRALKEQKP